MSSLLISQIVDDSKISNIIPIGEVSTAVVNDQDGVITITSNNATVTEVVKEDGTEISFYSLGAEAWKLKSTDPGLAVALAKIL